MGPEDRARIMEYNKGSDLRHSPYPGTARFFSGLNGAHAAERDADLFEMGYRSYRETLSPGLEPRSVDRGDVDYREPLGGRSPLRGLSRERFPSRDLASERYSGLLRELVAERRLELARERSPHRERRRPAPVYLRRRSPEGPIRRSRSPLRRHRSLSPAPRSRSRRSPPFGRRPAVGGPVIMHPEKRAMLRKCFCLKVTNVPPGTVYSAIWAHFKPHATVVFVEMAPAERAALVYLAHLEEREQALVNAERILPAGLAMEAWEGGSAALPAEPVSEEHPRANRTLLVGNLDKQLSRKDLRLAFKRIGPIVDVEIRRLPRAAAYYALLQFFSVRSVCKAIREMDGAQLGGLRLRCAFGVTAPDACVCAQGLAHDLSSAYIKLRFGRYGPVDKVAYNPQLGAALVLFGGLAEAEAALRDVQSRPGEGVSLDYADEHYQFHFCKDMQARGLDTGDFLFL